MCQMKELYKYMHAWLFVSRNKWVLFLSDSCKEWLIICESRKYLAVPPPLPPCSDTAHFLTIMAH